MFAPVGMHQGLLAFDYYTYLCRDIGSGPPPLGGGAGLR
jgi:hypothetical protein